MKRENKQRLSSFVKTADKEEKKNRRKKRNLRHLLLPLLVTRSVLLNK
jgi:hypothetical protein